MKPDLASKGKKRRRTSHSYGGAASLPKVDVLVKDVVAILQPLEVSAFHRLECALDAAPWESAEAKEIIGTSPSLSKAEVDRIAHNAIIKQHCGRKKKPPHRGGTWDDITKGLRRKHPGLPQHMIENAVCEAACRGLITVQHPSGDRRVTVTDQDELVALVSPRESRPQLDLIFRASLDAESDATQTRQPVTGTLISRTEFSCSDDFSSMVYEGERYSFTKMQAHAIRLLWEQNGHDLMEETIGEKIGSGATRFRLRKLFQDRVGRENKKHPAMDKVIVASGKGRYKIPRRVNSCAETRGPQKTPE